MSFGEYEFSLERVMNYRAGDGSMPGCRPKVMPDQRGVSLLRPHVALIRQEAPRRTLSHGFPPWEADYQQAQQWIAAGCFEATAYDPKACARSDSRRARQPHTALLVLERAPRRRIVEHDPAWAPGSVGRSSITSGCGPWWRVCTLASRLMPHRAVAVLGPSP